MQQKRKITKKVISKKTPPIKEQPQKDVQTPQLSPPKRGCFFCQNKKDPTFTDIITLKRYISDRGKIVPRARSGACSKHQRQITRQIKYARHLSLLPFTLKV